MCSQNNPYCKLIPDNYKLNIHINLQNNYKLIIFLPMPSYLSPLILFYVVLLLTTLSFSNSKLQEIELQQQNNTENHNTTISPFLTKLKGGQNRQRRARLQEHDCWLKPWICRKQLKPFEPMFCCRNRCVNVGSDPDNCGFCGIRCPFGWRCCHGICVDTMVMLYIPFHN